VGLPAARRLRQRRDFKSVYARGDRQRGRCIDVRALSGRDESVPTRIGVVVSTKVSKLAVVRNQYKRWLRAAVLQLQSRLNEGWRVVISVRPGAECKYEDLLRELEDLLARASVLREDPAALGGPASRVTASTAPSDPRVTPSDAPSGAAAESQ